ncbi:MAG: calcium-translocating P-type ATPase, PMCA-type [Oscillospiraceae bacterium]|nr:calcium-translocating P-type ATPase, PMCA-type [Oscillospiraceae bacterium]
MDWHSITAADALRELKSDGARGLTASQAAARLKSYGENRLSEKKQRGVLFKFFSQFSDFMVIILLLAAAVSFITAMINGEKDFVDPAVILGIVILNAVIGTAQESRAEKALKALKQMSAPHATVTRDGKKKRIDAGAIVPGDILHLSAGDMVAADARIIEESGLRTQESALTGESMPCEKNADAVLSKSCTIGDRKNMILSSTVILAGHCTAVAAETGMNTQIGRIARLLNEEESPQTPLQIRLSKVSKILGIGALAICALIFVIGLLNRVPLLDSFMLSVSLAVAAIPEGLTAIVTVVLSLGVQRMAKSNAIVRRLPTVETLGAATVICSDKTGTLTQNKMTVTAVRLPDGDSDMSGDGAKTLLSMGALCCNASLSDTKSKRETSGDPTEIAIILAADGAGIRLERLKSENPRVRELPFDSARKLMTTVHKTPAGFRQITKGAPDILLERCDRARMYGTAVLTQQKKAELLSQNDKMAADALRVIAVAYRDLTSAVFADENGLIFAGFIGMADPPRQEAAEAVKTCREAGITPVMITGDHVITAKAVARQLGISNEKSAAITGAELDRFSDAELLGKIGDCRVFARVTPEHKVRIVKAFRQRGEIVAMTGDGVNDAPALKAADIGCAMGLSGTDVAKGAADMILTDDNFATIVKAVSEGRGIYDNIKKAVHFLLSCNIGEILVILAASLLQMPSPLLPIHLLWVNLVTDSLPAMALGVENKEKNIMKRPPAPPNESFFANRLGFDIAVEGLLVGALTLLAFVIGRRFLGASLTHGRTMAFATLSICEIIHAVSMRSNCSIFKTGFFSNKRMVWAVAVCTAMQMSVITVPALSSIFDTVALNTVQWLTVFGLSFVPFILIEIEKMIKTRKPNAR